MKKFFPFILFTAGLFAGLPPLSAQDNEQLLAWNARNKLTWDDYLGNPDDNSDAAASTTTYLRIDYKISSGSFGYTIRSLFSKNKSWGRNKTVYILSHEQGHFDIAEIFARKLHQKMSSYRFNRNTYERDLQKIYDDVVREKEDMQYRYDKETRHSINREKQQEWLDKIAQMLKESESYADYQNSP